MKRKHFNNFNILVIWCQMSGVSLFLNCACVLAAPKGEEEERRKGCINRVGKKKKKSRWKGGGSISENGSSVLPGPWDKNLGFILISFLSYLTSHLVADLGGCIFKVHPGSG